MKPILYLRMKKKTTAEIGQPIKVKDVCRLMADEEEVQMIQETPIADVTPSVGNYLMIDVLDVYRLIAEKNPRLDIRHIGPAQTIVEIQKKTKRLPKRFFVALVWLILFIGSGLTIMNFHTDVSMQEVHQRIFYLITGKQEERPLSIQIPYSLGIGAGMILFFNHLLKKKFSDEPSPLDLEVFLYQENLDQYVIDNERKKNDGSDST